MCFALRPSPSLTYSHDPLRLCQQRLRTLHIARHIYNMGHVKVHALFARLGNIGDEVNNDKSRLGDFEATIGCQIREKILMERKTLHIDSGQLFSVQRNTFVFNGFTQAQCAAMLRAH